MCAESGAKVEAGERTGPQDRLAQQKVGARCDPSKLLVYSDIAVMEDPTTDVRHGRRHKDGQTLDRHIVLGRPGEALQERGRCKSRVRAPPKLSSPRYFPPRCAGSPALWVVRSQAALGRE